MTDWKICEISKYNAEKLSKIVQGYIIDHTDSSLTSLSHAEVIPKTIGINYTFTIYNATVEDSLQHCMVHLERALERKDITNMTLFFANDKVPDHLKAANLHWHGIVYIEKKLR
jgi:hypothetical protein